MVVQGYQVYLELLCPPFLGLQPSKRRLENPIKTGIIWVPGVYWSPPPEPQNIGPKQWPFMTGIGTVYADIYIYRYNIRIWLSALRLQINHNLPKSTHVSPRWPRFAPNRWSPFDVKLSWTKNWPKSNLTQNLDFWQRGGNSKLMHRILSWLTISPAKLLGPCFSMDATCLF